MLATLTSKNQLTLPKRIVGHFAGVRHFNVEMESGRIVIEPFNPVSLDAVRQKIAALGITETDMEGAVSWARKTPRGTSRCVSSWTQTLSSPRCFFGQGT